MSYKNLDKLVWLNEQTIHNCKTFIKKHGFQFQTDLDTENLCEH